MDPLTGAVIITGLTTVGKPTAEVLTSVVGKILGPSFDAVGQGIAAPILPAFAEILHQLTPVQANILQLMYERKTEQQVPGWPPHWPDVARADIESKFKLSHADYALLITDLERLNLIEPRRDIKAGAVGAEVPMDELLQLVVDRWNSRVKYESIGFTALDLGFIAACTPPVKST
jgi:hypothetical protein